MVVILLAIMLEFFNADGSLLISAICSDLLRTISDCKDEVKWLGMCLNGKKSSFDI